MREHTHLPAMVGFVRNHVAQHFRANRPGPTPAVSAKVLDATTTAAERFGEHRFGKHFGAASGALGQSCAGLLRRAVCAVELSGNLQVRSGKPDPLAADVVHVREYRRDGTDLFLQVLFAGGFAGRLGCRFRCRSRFPGGGVKMFDENLVHAVVGEKDLDGGAAELSANLALMNSVLTNFVLTNLGLTRGHGSLLLDPPAIADSG